MPQRSPIMPSPPSGASGPNRKSSARVPPESIGLISAARIISSDSVLAGFIQARFVILSLPSKPLMRKFSEGTVSKPAADSCDSSQFNVSERLRGTSSETAPDIHLCSGRKDQPFSRTGCESSRCLRSCWVPCHFARQHSHPSTRRMTRLQTNDKTPQTTKQCCRPRLRDGDSRCNSHNGLARIAIAYTQCLQRGLCIA